MKFLVSNESSASPGITTISTTTSPTLSCSTSKENDNKSESPVVLEYYSNEWLNLDDKNNQKGSFDTTKMKTKTNGASITSRKLFHQEILPACSSDSSATVEQFKDQIINLKYILQQKDCELSIEKKKYDLMLEKKNHEISRYKYDYDLMVEKKNHEITRYKHELELHKIQHAAATPSVLSPLPSQSPQPKQEQQQQHHTGGSSNSDDCIKVLVEAQRSTVSLLEQSYTRLKDELKACKLEYSKSLTTFELQEAILSALHDEADTINEKNQICKIEITDKLERMRIEIMERVLSELKTGFEALSKDVNTRTETIDTGNTESSKHSSNVAFEIQHCSSTNHLQPNKLCLNKNPKSILKNNFVAPIMASQVFKNSGSNEKLFIASSWPPMKSGKHKWTVEYLKVVDDDNDCPPSFVGFGVVTVADSCEDGDGMLGSDFFGWGYLCDGEVWKHGERTKKLSRFAFGDVVTFVLDLKTASGNHSYDHGKLYVSVNDSRLELIATDMTFHAEKKGGFSPAVSLEGAKVKLTYLEYTEE